MKAWIVSDLHLELGPSFDAPVPADADVMVCAGDVLDKGIVPTLEWLASTVARRLPVIVVAGNHEYYGAAMLPSLEAARAVAKRDLHHSLGLDVREGIDEHPVDHAEHGARGADAQGQREHGGDGERRTAAQFPRGVTQIGDDRSHERL